MKLSIEELKKMRKHSASLCHDSHVSAIDELITIRELKGDQVPVALVDERQGSGGFCLTQHGRALNLQHGTELFTSPQKPVVLDDATILAWGDRNYIQGDVSKLRCMIEDAATLPAGGIVTSDHSGDGDDKVGE